MAAICLRDITATVLLLAGLYWGSGLPAAYAQAGTVQGNVSDRQSRKPLEGVNVVLQDDIDSGELRGTATADDGFFQIRNIDAGTYFLQISYVGYETYRDTLTLAAGERQSLNVSLARGDELMDEVLVAVDQGAARREAGRQKVTSVDLGRVPTPAGGGDLANYLRTMPGVVATGDRGGQLFVRGGTPAENLVLIDGALIYQPFHIVGFFSVFPEDLIASADFYAGGFGPRYNGRTSSVLDVQMRDGNRDQVKGSASVSPFVGELTLEGPFQNGGDASASWIVSIRRSLIEELSPVFVGEEQPLHFDSQFLKVSHFSDQSSSRCSAMALRTGDRGRLDFEGDDTFRWNNVVLGGQCILPPAKTGVLVETNISFSHLSNSTGIIGQSDLYSSVSRAHMGVNLTRFSGRIKYNYGVFTHLRSTIYDMQELFRSQKYGEETMLGLSLHLEATIPLGERLRVMPGAALSLYREEYNPSFEPRLRTVWQPLGRDDEELYGTVGLYRQSITGVSDMRDVSSAFTAWMPVPTGGSQMESMHTLLGWQQRLGSGFQWSAEGYYKQLRHIPVTVWSTLAEFTTELAMAKGRVFGGDLRLEYNRGRLYGLLGYALTWTEYESAQEHFSVWFGEPVQRYHPPHDRRHQINSMLSLILGNFKVGLRWQLGSGLPYTRPMGFDGLLHFRDELPDVRTDYGTPRVILEKPYQGRLPTFHRLDLSLEREFTFTGGRLRLQAGAINLYDQRNIFYYDVYTHRRIDQMPFAPYVSLKYTPRP